MMSLQKFASVHATVRNHFSLERHLTDRATYKNRRSAALAEWQPLIGSGGSCQSKSTGDRGSWCGVGAVHASTQKAA